MIERYTRPAMGSIWSEAAKYQAWLRVEVAVCEAYARRGRIPPEALARIRDTRVDIDRILAIQGRVKHEMIALLTSLEEQLGPDSRFVHIGLTTKLIELDADAATPARRAVAWRVSACIANTSWKTTRSTSKGPNRRPSEQVR